jgi:hypothetical protein
MNKDIEILKEFENYSPYEEIGETGKQAIKNTLKELETYKKIAKHLAYAIEHNLQDDIITDIVCDFTKDNKLCREKCIQCIIDWARKEVEKEC